MKKKILLLISIAKILFYVILYFGRGVSLFNPVFDIFYYFLTKEKGIRYPIFSDRIVLFDLILILPLILSIKNRKLFNDLFSKGVLLIDIIMTIVLILQFWLGYILVQGMGDFRFGSIIKEAGLQNIG